MQDDNALDFSFGFDSDHSLTTTQTKERRAHRAKRSKAARDAWYSTMLATGDAEAAKLAARDAAGDRR